MFGAMQASAFSLRKAVMAEMEHQARHSESL
jgi:hypothetical protein